jgi:hypothetical protein
VSIELHIERLVIDEAALGDEHAAGVRAAIERELARRLAQAGAVDALRGLGAVAMLSPATLPPARHPHDPLGMRIAAAVQQGLGITPATRVAGKEQ